LRGLKWSEEKIAAFSKYRIKSGNQNTPLESDLEDQFEEMWRIRHPLDIFDDEYSESDDEEEAQEQMGTQVSVQGEKPMKVIKEAILEAAQR